MLYCWSTDKTASGNHSQRELARERQSGKAIAAGYQGHDMRRSQPTAL